MRSRPPSPSALFSTLTTLDPPLVAVFALLGFLSPSNRGALSTVMVVCWTLFGFVAGYVSSRLYVTMKGDAIRKNIIYTALVFPS